MTRTVFVTGGDAKVNRQIADYLLDRGYRLTLLFREPDIARQYARRLSSGARGDGCAIDVCLDGGQAVGALKRTIERAGELDALVHGIDWLDEPELLERDPMELDRLVTDRLKEIYALTRTAVQHMARKKKGQIVFPLLSDSMSGIGYPSSPIVNNGKIAMMKSLARELAPFRIGVNAVTFGYGLLDGGDGDDDGDDDNVSTSGPNEAVPSAARRASFRKQLEIYALKPTLLPFAELLSAMDIFLQAADHRISGQNLHVGAGVDTPV